MPSRLEAAITALQDGIRAVWQFVALQPPPPEAMAAAQKAALIAQEKLTDCTEFLGVRDMAPHKRECRSQTANRYSDGDI